MSSTNTNEAEDDQIVRLRSTDGVEFELPFKAAKLSILVRTGIECETTDDGEDHQLVEYIDLIKIRSECLAMVVEFLNHYAEEPMTPFSTPLGGNSINEIVSQEWYRNFIDCEQPMVFELVTAANYMEIQPLLDLSCLRVSCDLMGKTAEEIRVILNIPKMTEEEERVARQEHRWIFED